MRFRARIELHGKTATGIVVPPEVVESLQSGKRPPVRVTINGYTYRSTVAVLATLYIRLEKIGGSEPRISRRSNLTCWLHELSPE